MKKESIIFIVTGVALFLLLLLTIFGPRTFGHAIFQESVQANPGQLVMNPVFSVAQDGDIIEYTISAYFTGNVNGVQVEFDLPAGLQFISAESLLPWSKQAPYYYVGQNYQDPLQHVTLAHGFFPMADAVVNGPTNLFKIKLKSVGEGTRIVEPKVILSGNVEIVPVQAVVSDEQPEMCFVSYGSINFANTHICKLPAWLNGLHIDKKFNTFNCLGIRAGVPILEKAGTIYFGVKQGFSLEIVPAGVTKFADAVTKIETGSVSNLYNEFLCPQGEGVKCDLDSDCLSNHCAVPLSGEDKICCSETKCNFNPEDDACVSAGSVYQEKDFGLAIGDKICVDGDWLFTETSCVENADCDTNLCQDFECKSQLGDDCSILSCAEGVCYENTCQPDSDGDGFADAEDNCVGVVNNQKDTDDDGVGDACDADIDNDGVDNGIDNCPVVANNDQLDTNGDGVGDVCSADSDGDGVTNRFDNCPLVKNGNCVQEFRGAPLNCDIDLNGVHSADEVLLGNQKDSDGDGQGDACDVDIDGDLVPQVVVPGSVVDNCPYIYNSDQIDSDGDGIGDVCDTDDDNDGVVDSQDNCPLDFNDQVDTDLDGIGDVCDTDDDNDGVLDVDDVCPLDAENLCEEVDDKCPFFENKAMGWGSGNSVGCLFGDQEPYDGCLTTEEFLTLQYYYLNEDDPNTIACLSEDFGDCLTTEEFLTLQYYYLNEDDPNTIACI